MAKSTRKIKEIIKAIDLVVEIVDARAPLSSSNPDLMTLFQNKPKLLLINKTDLLKKSIKESWTNYFEHQKTNFLFFDSKNKPIKKIFFEAIEKTLQDKIASLHKKGVRKPKFTIMIVGIPNIGKSTFINAIVGKNKLKSANKPGLTRGNQIVKIHDGLDLIDTPGILVPKISSLQQAIMLITCHCLKLDVLKDRSCIVELTKWFIKNNDNFIKNYFREIFLDFRIDASNYTEKQIFEIWNKLIKKINPNLNNDRDQISAFVNFLNKHATSIIFEKPEDFINE